MQPGHRSGTYARELHRLYAGGLIVISLIILQGFLNLGNLNPSALVSILAFALALPLLSATPILDVVERRFRVGPRRTAITRSVHVAFMLGVVVDLVGVGAAFWHLTWIAGVTFLSGLLLTCIVYGIYILNLDEDVGHP